MTTSSWEAVRHSSAGPLLQQQQLTQVVRLQTLPLQSWPHCWQQQQRLTAQESAREFPGLGLRLQPVAAARIEQPFALSLPL